MTGYLRTTQGYGRIFLALAAVSSTLTAGADGPTFQGIGFLPNMDRSEAYGVSHDGSAVVGWSKLVSQEAAVWTDDRGLIGLGLFPGGNTSTAEGISGDGQIIVGNSGMIVGVNVPFVWTSRTGHFELPKLVGYPRATATAISGDGSIVVGFSRDVFGTGAEEATVWLADGTPMGLGDLPGGDVYSHALGVNNAGTVIVGFGTTLEGIAHEAARWTQAEGIVSLGFIPDWAGLTQARAVSDDGDVVVGYANQGFLQQAFRWTPTNGMEGLGFVPGFSSTSKAYGVTADGSVIVGISSAGSTGIAFLWDEEHGMRDLRNVLIDLSGGEDLMDGWIGMQANDISDDGGSIVGFGTDPDGLRQGWIATLPTECLWDLDGNGVVGASDLLALLANWGSCKGCLADFDGNGNVGASDLLTLLANWGPCP